MLKLAIMMFLRPLLFEQLAKKQQIEKLIKEWPIGASSGPSPEKLQSVASDAHKQISSMRRALFGGIFITAVPIILGTCLGFVCSKLFCAPSKVCVYLIQASGAAITLGATLGEVGRDISTIDGNTLPERVNGYLFKALCTLGTFPFALSASWDAFA
jgi:hypothetical protein